MNEIKKVNVRVGDEVVVIAGTYKGKKGKVLSVNPTDNTCVVKDVNIISKHKKMRKQGEKSEIKKMEGSIDISNVQIVCGKCGKATRVGHQIDDKKVKHRVCKKCGNVLDKKYVKPKTKAEEKAEVAAEEKATKKPLQRREVKHVAESTVKKPASAKTATAAKPDEKGGK